MAKSVASVLSGLRNADSCLFPRRLELSTVFYKDHIVSIRKSQRSIAKALNGHMAEWEHRSGSEARRRLKRIRRARGIRRARWLTTARSMYDEYFDSKEDSQDMRVFLQSCGPELRRHGPRAFLGFLRLCGCESPPDVCQILFVLGHPLADAVVLRMRSRGSVWKSKKRDSTLLFWMSRAVTPAAFTGFVTPAMVRDEVIRRQLSPAAYHGVVAFWL